MHMPEFRCSLAAPPTALDHVWEHTVGSGHAPLGLRADWQRQLSRCHRELGFRHVRFHGILSDDMGTLICHKEEFLYSFFNADSIFDYLLSIGMKPFVELSFMPATLSSGGETVFRYRGNITPPRDMGQWGELIDRLVRHWIDRYGQAEVREWFFEVWNEPNLKAFWTGTQTEYFELYRCTARVIKGIHPDLKVGGPSSAANEWLPAFQDYCERHDVPPDFLTTHHYPTDAFGQPGDDTITQLSRSHRSVLRDQAILARAQARGRPLYYTEWNSSSNPRDPLHDQSYAAAFLVKTVMEASGLVQGYSFWTFTDVFAENYHPSVPFHGGFGLLNLHGIPKPTYSAMAILHRAGNVTLPVEGQHSTVDAWVTRNDPVGGSAPGTGTGNGRLAVLLTNHALPLHPLSQEKVHLRIDGLAQKPASVRIERIDEEHANPRRGWIEMGSPDYLSPDQAGELEMLAAPAPVELPCSFDGGSLLLELDLLRHSVAAVTIDP